MVGLSVILENYRDLSENHHHHAMITKGSMMNMTKPPYQPCCPNSPTPMTPPPNKTMSDYLCSSSSPSSSFYPGLLDNCFFCKRKLLPGNDIYMYKGEMAFCTDDCRQRQIFMGEEGEIAAAAKGGCTGEYNCSLTATSSTPSSSTTHSSNASRGVVAGGPRAAAARANAFFAY